MGGGIFLVQRTVGPAVYSPASDTGHSIPRPTAYGSRVPPSGHLLGEHPAVPPGRSADIKIPPAVIQQRGERRSECLQLLAGQELISFLVLGNGLVDDILRQIVVAVGIGLEPVADELLIERGLTVADGLFQNWEEVYAHTDEHGTLIQPNAKPGDIRFKDRDHNGVLDANDKDYIGNPYPDLMMGLNIGMRYKNIDFAANFYGTFGNDIYNVTKGRYSGSGGQNVWAGTLEKAWHGEGTGNDIPRLSSNDLNLNYSRVSSFYVEDGSYLRCKLLQIGYTLPKKWVGGADLRLSFSAQNPFTITGYSGMDPERPMVDGTTDSSGSAINTGIDNVAYPNPRTFLFGIDFKF